MKAPSPPPTKFINFDSSIQEYALPNKFTFPFNYQPHPIAQLAAKQLQKFLNRQTTFGLNNNLETGKMFGVLVVQNTNNEIGYLAAFSGNRLDGKSHHPFFVPPVFDIEEHQGFYKKEENEISKINRSIASLESSQEFIDCIDLLQEKKSVSATELSSFRKHLKKSKNIRKQKREKAQVNMTESQFIELNNELQKESLHQKSLYKKAVQKWKDEIDLLHSQYEFLNNKIDTLKKQRKTRSSILQQKLFEHYKFLNQEGRKKNLTTIFKETPPAGAGECAAPKLLQYAYINNLTPIALSEFWWGAPSKLAVRKHLHYYPACTSKCKPILAHMLKGLEVDPDPIQSKNYKHVNLEILFKDDSIIVINKPHDFLSVPGKEIDESVYNHIKTKCPSVSGPLIVHRLDMATSGVMVIAKSKEVHQNLQKQFADRIVKKQYTALLDGEINKPRGTINLPLRVDLTNRPQQIICFEHGKESITKWEVVNIKGGQTKVHFFPLTGRTHQLRIHAAHPNGLNASIVGDELYGTKNNRLHLHAEKIEFIHPKSNRIVVFTSPSPF